MTDIDYTTIGKELTNYHSFTDTVAVYPGAGHGNLTELSYLALGLASESGEAVDIIKKILRRGGVNPGDDDKLRDELGDVMFYWTRLCYAAGIDPADVFIANVAKLQQRKDTGTLKDRPSDS